ncbi:MAG TPA: hypothetical protein VHP83_20480 [Aggregatilineaceae bacterium]|nr:hypothetical protein [Aggregatilineaceae bacterium]
MTPKQKIKQQRQQRHAGEIKRVEFVLYSDSERDQEIFDHLESLPPGQRGEFIRRALYAAILGQQIAPEPEKRLVQTTTVQQQMELPEPAQPESSDTSASEQFNAIMRELVELRAVVEKGKTAEKRVQSVARSGPENNRQNDSEPAAIPDEKVIVSSGLDMSGPRRRAGSPPRISVPSAVIPEPAFSPEDSAMLLLNSIRGYGAQNLKRPGK